MSYFDQIDNTIFSIRTGDGNLFFPNWKGGSKETEYNTSMFDFISVTGTLVDRKKPRSPFFDLVFYFQGEDYLDIAKGFEISASDSRPWLVTHPIYGEISGQPLSLKRDDSNLNIVEITIPFWESIEAEYPFTNFNIKDNTRQKKAKLFTLCASSYITNNSIKTKDISKIKSNVLLMSSSMKSMQDNSTYSDFQNQLNKTLKAVDNLLKDPFEAIQQVQNFIDLPSTYLQVLEARISAYESIYTRLKSTINTVSDKKYFESASASVIGSLSVVLINPIQEDYVLVSDVFKASQRLSKIYNDYISILDSVSVSAYDVNNSFNPDASVQSELSSLVQYTIANLYKLSFDAKREKIIFVEKDTNPILLVHRYIGLDNDDVNLANFVKTNNLKLKELFLVKKGRDIRITI